VERVAVNPLKDRRWNPAGAHDERFRTMLINMGASILWTALIVIIAWFWRRQEDPTSSQLIPFNFVHILLLLPVGFYVYEFVKWLKFGSSDVRFAQFPYNLGERCEIRFVKSRRLRATKLRFSIVCYVEIDAEAEPAADEPRMSMGGIAPYRIYRDELDVEIPEMDRGRNVEVPVEFMLPDKVELSTQLEQLPITYWELEVRAELPGLDFKTAFLIPIYARSAEG